MPNENQPDKEILAFVDSFGLHLQETGLPLSVGRVLGFLLICKPNHQSLEEIQEKLQLSTGSVNTATTLLRRLGFIQRVVFSNDRRHYYRVEDDCWQKLIEARSRQLMIGLKIAEDGLKIRKDDPRLLGMHYVYTEFLGFIRKLSQSSH